MSFDFDAAVQAPFRMQPGLRRLAPGALQLTPLAPGSRHQREKMAVLSAFPRLALAAEPGFDAWPALRALAEHAAREHPGRFVWADGRAEARWLGVAVVDGEVEQLASGVFGLGDELARCLRGLTAEWRLPGLLGLAFAEDLAIVDGARATIPWIAACLPSHWDPAAKVGHHFAEVHAPVADNALLMRAAEHLMRMVCGPDAWERFVWNVTRHPRLHAHPVHADPAPWPADAFDDPDPRAWFRSERQTFLPLPSLRQAVFTIGVDCRPLAQAIDSAARARRLHDSIASMSADVLAYRSLAPARDALLGWLERRAAVPA
ncbi:MAG TPA: heme-dependent oxidative N-demethylase subunit alpha family protein [Burkholderiaceae bacterium]|nr:heme-dependent oxidative N-demethylase subunit alpha family protein [Burkholderiaceae bacterium]